MSVTGVASVTDLYNPQILPSNQPVVQLLQALQLILSNQPLLQVLQSLQPSFFSVTSVTSDTAFIFRCCKRYKCYTLYSLSKMKALTL